MKVKQILEERSMFTEQLENNYTVKQYGGLKRLKAAYKKEALAFAYRGMKAKSGSDVVRIVTRQDRRPTDTGKATHDVLNKAMFEAFGFPYRSAAVFASSSINTAFDYGNDTFIVLPEQQYTVCYSPDIDDFLAIFEKFHKLIETNLDWDENKPMLNSDAAFNKFMQKLPQDSDQYYDVIDAAEKAILQMGYKEVDSIVDIESRSAELMIACKSYLAVRVRRMDEGDL